METVQMHTFLKMNRGSNATYLMRTSFISPYFAFGLVTKTQIDNYRTLPNVSPRQSTST